LRLLAVCAALALALVAPAANAAVVPDDARESRWADEVVPRSSSAT
jgi:hypothetical protein